ncbi:hypothetical protein Z517_06133 [Fonsecaea pedrosoi CBS 271.37]|uniref:Uncharacterized protein n=1 Tax=Fonsecaea pedrosoi CBS 271.37 TaxID=1442368 RepID=A0A0D2DP66_9EURO|nr:uncharacterized protein Z517_06133 [Fonsecaea pedrosoi CBS 271.37]KIW79521.1 hypothetical protein Z517_06133 [Fonsecaea pedrosoi CBS 271.37]
MSCCHRANHNHGHSHNHNHHQHHQHSQGPCQCYRCQKSRSQPTLHPAIGIPLAIATGGLSCAAIGIYRGYIGYRDRAARETIRDIVPEQGGCGPEQAAAIAVRDVADVEHDAGPRAAVSSGMPDASLAMEPPPPRYTEIDNGQMTSDATQKM